MVEADDRSSSPVRLAHARLPPAPRPRSRCSSISSWPLTWGRDHPGDQDENVGREPVGRQRPANAPNDWPTTTTSFWSPTAGRRRRRSPSAPPSHHRPEGRGPPRRAPASHLGLHQAPVPADNAPAVDQKRRCSGGSLRRSRPVSGSKKWSRSVSKTSSTVSPSRPACGGPAAPRTMPFSSSAPASPRIASWPAAAATSAPRTGRPPGRSGRTPRSPGPRGCRYRRDRPRRAALDQARVLEVLRPDPGSTASPRRLQAGARLHERVVDPQAVVAELHRQPPSPRTRSAPTRFIAGDPMNSATKRFVGRS